MFDTTEAAAFLREIGAKFEDEAAYAAALAKVAGLTRERDKARAGLNALLSYTEYALGVKVAEAASAVKEGGR